MSSPTAFGGLVKTALYKRGATQEWLARQAGIAPTSLSRAIRGQRRPGAELVLRISSILGLSRDDEDNLLIAAGYSRESAGVLQEPPVETGGSDGAWTFPAPVKSPRRQTRDRDQLRRLLAHVEELRSMLEAMIAEAKGDSAP